MDIWEKLYLEAKKEYHPEEVSPFIDAHHVVCAIEAEDGNIYSGFCIEGASGVMALCAERVAGLNMYIQSGQTVVKRMIAFRKDHAILRKTTKDALCKLPEISLHNGFPWNGGTDYNSKLIGIMYAGRDEADVRARQIPEFSRRFLPPQKIRRYQRD